MTSVASMGASGLGVQMRQNAWYLPSGRCWMLTTAEVSRVRAMSTPTQTGAPSTNSQGLIRPSQTATASVPSQLVKSCGALHAGEARHLGLALALGPLDVRVDGLVEPGRAQHETLGLAVHDLGLLSRGSRDGNDREGAGLGVVEREARQERRLPVALGHDEPALGPAREEVADEGLLEGFQTPGLAGVEDEIGGPSLEVWQRERATARRGHGAATFVPCAALPGIMYRSI